MDPELLQKNSRDHSESETSPLIFRYSHHFAAVKRLRSLIFILVLLITILVILTLSLTIYLVIKSDNDDSTKPVGPLVDGSTPRPFGTLPSWPGPSRSPMGFYSTVAVVADHGLCSEIGRDILIEGGNAVDSAIAALVCIGVVSPQSSGLGGGFFMTFYNRTSKSCIAIDARERAPLNASQNMFENDTSGSFEGYLAIGVPGQVAGLWEAYQNFGGGVPWKNLLQPSIDLCEVGFPVSRVLADTIGNFSVTIKNETTMNMFINNETQNLYKYNEIIKLPKLAQTLRQLANATNPAELFYSGDMMKTIVKELSSGGGVITEEDFKNYTVKWGSDRPVINTTIKENLIICGPPPPSSSSITTSIIKILDGYDINPAVLNTVESNVVLYHRLLEAIKFAYGAHELMGDMDFADSALELATNITSASYASEIRAKILAKGQAQDYYRLQSAFNDHGTSHVSVVDSFGNAVAATASINTAFGAKVASNSTGIIWNNHMDDFSQPNQSNFFHYTPFENNFIEPMKRPLSSMSPLIVFNEDSGNVKAVVGASGGSTIISATAQILFRTIYLNQTIKEALDSPRLHNQLEPFVTRYEKNFPEVFIRELMALEQNMVPQNKSPSFANGIVTNPDGTLEACGDYRRDTSYPAGY